MRCDVEFKPHPFLDNHLKASYCGSSILHGPVINGYEIMTPDGECQSGLTLEQAIEIAEKNDV